MWSIFLVWKQDIPLFKLVMFDKHIRISTPENTGVWICCIICCNIMELGMLLRLPLTVHQYPFPLVGVKPWSWEAHSCWILSGFLWHKAARSISTPPGWDASSSQLTPGNLLGFSNNLLVPIHMPGWREALWGLSVLPKNTTQCPWPGLEPKLLDLDTSAITLTSLHLCSPCWSINFHYYWLLLAITRSFRLVSSY